MMKRPTVEELKEYAKGQGFAEDFLNYPRDMIEYWIARTWGDGTIDPDLAARYEAAKKEHKHMIKVRLGVA